jgi:threonine/homoserine/homoserine lactone efflux protein
VAAGFGPINVYCLSTGLRHGFQPAWGVGLGAAVVDGLYALLAGLGAAALFTGGANGWFQILGGVALVAVAVRMALAARRAVQRRERGGARLRTTFALSLRRRSRTR